MAFPATIQTLPTNFLQDQIIEENYLNDIDTEINAIEAWAGVNAQGTFTTLANRLNARLTCRKTADQANATVTPANVTDMVLPINTTGLDYYFKFIVAYSSTAVTTGIAFSVTSPAVAAGGYLSAAVEIFGRVNDPAIGTAPTASNMMLQGNITASNDEVGSEATVATNGIYIARIEGIFSNPSAVGSLQLRHRSETAVSTTVKKGSWGEVYIN